MKKINISEGLLIVACPLIAYFLVFCYEIGFCLYFDIPFELISPSKITLLLVTMIIFLLILIIFLFFISLFTYPPIKKFSNTNITFIISLLLTIGFGILMFFSRGNLVLKLYGMFLIMLFSVINLIKISQQTIAKRLATKEDASEKSAKIDLLQKFKISFFFIIFIVSVGFSSYYTGFSRAHNKKWYFVCEGTPPKILLRVYGDKFIFVAVDKQTKEVQNEFFIYNTANISNLKLTYEKFGCPIMPEFRGL